MPLVYLVLKHLAQHGFLTITGGQGSVHKNNHVWAKTVSLTTFYIRQASKRERNTPASVVTPQLVNFLLTLLLHNENLMCGCYLQRQSFFYNPCSRMWSKYWLYSLYLSEENISFLHISHSVGDERRKSLTGAEDSWKTEWRSILILQFETQQHIYRVNEFNIKWEQFTQAQLWQIPHLFKTKFFGGLLYTLH